MPKHQFDFKQFTVRQYKAGFKVGTDGCLLGALSPLEGVKNILDVGTGTGVISLMLAQRSGAKITALDIDPGSAAQAQENFDSSPWKDRLTSLHSSLQDHEPVNSYDLVVSNPPFFKDSTRSGDNRKDRARHQDTLSLKELSQHAYRITSWSGQLHVIIPLTESSDLVECAQADGWHLKRRLSIRPSEDKEVNRVILEFSKVNGTKLSESTLTIYRDHPHYHEDVVPTLAPFYLRL